MATLEDIKVKIAKLQEQAEAIAKKQSLTVVTKIRDLMDKHGLSLADLESHFAGSKRRGHPAKSTTSVKSAGAAKYLDPKTGATWTGHGRAPAWIANAKDRSKFLIAGGADSPAKAGKGAAKTGNYVRGPQAAKYRDPKTGATWSGRGRAPAWLAGTKSRAAFLIDGVGEVATKGAAATKASPKKVSAKKAVTRKAAAKKVATKKLAAEKAAARKIMAEKKPSVKKAASRKAPTKKAVAKKVAASAVALAETPTQANDGSAAQIAS